MENSPSIYRNVFNRSKDNGKQGTVEVLRVVDTG
jgi:hypothetical protein